MLEATHPKIVLALKHESIQKLTELDLQNVQLLDNQLTFNLMLQQEVYIKDTQSPACTSHEEQWRGSQDHQKKGDTRIQVQPMVLREGYHKQNLPQKSNQVLPSHV